MWNYFWIYRAFSFIGANLSTTKTWLKFHNPMWDLRYLSQTGNLTKMS